MARLPPTPVVIQQAKVLHLLCTCLSIKNPARRCGWVRPEEGEETAHRGR